LAGNPAKAREGERRETGAGKACHDFFCKTNAFHPSSRYDLISVRSSLTSGVFSRKLAKPPMRYSHNQHLYAP
jgi:hypothetical protein